MKMKLFLHAILLTASLVATCLPGKVQADEEPETGDSERPNLIIIFVDDMGYADIGSFGADVIRTPVLDQMATEGMLFTDFYAQPMCGPSRTALMTGCYPLRVAQVNNLNLVMPAVHPDEITMAEVLRERGYATGCYGKWDMAGHSQTDFRPQAMPNEQGFDDYFGTPSSNGRPPHLYRNGELAERNASLETLTERFTDEALRFIDEHHEEPFFLYLAQSMPHTKLAVTDPFRGNSPRGLYGDVIEELDANVGRLFEKLDELNLNDNTYVLFTSDNGPSITDNEGWRDGIEPEDHGGSAGPLRAGKYSTWEGGVRVSTIWWAPGRIPAGTTCNALTATIDLLPTFAELAGATVPTDRTIDGVDISPLLTGDFEQADPDRVFYYYLKEHLQAVRQGPWKLHLANVVEQSGRTRLNPGQRPVAPADSLFMSAHQLYHLGDDIGESTDLAEQHPEVVERLVALADQAREDIGDTNRIGEGARFFESTEEFPPRANAHKR